MDNVLEVGFVWSQWQNAHHQTANLGHATHRSFGCKHVTVSVFFCCRRLLFLLLHMFTSKRHFSNCLSGFRDSWQMIRIFVVASVHWSWSRHHQCHLSLGWYLSPPVIQKDTYLWNSFPQQRRKARPTGQAKREDTTILVKCIFSETPCSCFTLSVTVNSAFSIFRSADRPRI